MHPYWRGHQLYWWSDDRSIGCREYQLYRCLYCPSGNSLRPTKLYRARLLSFLLLSHAGLPLFDAVDKGTTWWGVEWKDNAPASYMPSYKWHAYSRGTLVYQVDQAVICGMNASWHVLAAQANTAYCYLVAQAVPCPSPTGKVRALTPLAVDWFRGVPSPYPPSLSCLPSLSALLPPVFALLPVPLSHCCLLFLLVVAPFCLCS